MPLHTSAAAMCCHAEHNAAVEYGCSMMHKYCHAAEAMDDTDMRPSDDSDEETLPLPLAPAGSLRPGIVHRLDKGTTGQSTA